MNVVRTSSWWAFCLCLTRSTCIICTNSQAGFLAWPHFASGLIMPPPCLELCGCVGYDLNSMIMSVSKRANQLAQPAPFPAGCTLPHRSSKL